MSDSIEMKDMYGAFGIKTIDGTSSFIEQWVTTGGDPDFMSGLVMIANHLSRHMTLWKGEVFNRER